MRGGAFEEEYEEKEPRRGVGVSVGGGCDSRAKWAAERRSRSTVTQQVRNGAGLFAWTRSDSLGRESYLTILLLAGRSYRGQFC